MLPSTMLIYSTDCAVATNHVYLIQMSGQSICSVFADLMCMSTTSFYNMISNGNNLNIFLLPWTMKSLYESTHIEMGSKTLIYLILGQSSLSKKSADPDQTAPLIRIYALCYSNHIFGCISQFIITNFII